MTALWLKRWILAAALAAMPLQGVAAVMSSLVCHGGAQAHVTHQDSDDHVTHHDGHSDAGSTTGDDTAHPCCHFTAFAPSAVTLPAAQPEFPIRAFVPDSPHDLFVPDRPQRPPLA